MSLSVDIRQAPAVDSTDELDQAVYGMLFPVAVLVLGVPNTPDQKSQDLFLARLSFYQRVHGGLGIQWNDDHTEYSPYVVTAENASRFFPFFTNATPVTRAQFLKNITREFDI